MKIVTLLPLSKRSKQIIKQHGERWEVLKTQQRVLFSGAEGPWMLVTPITEERVHQTVRETREDTASRWVHAFFDPNFKVVP